MVEELDGDGGEDEVLYGGIPYEYGQGGPRRSSTLKYLADR